MKTKLLYHYTSLYHLPIIKKAGFLKLTESNLRYPEQYYRPVVWMTTSEDTIGHGLEGSLVDKTEIKFTIKWQKHYKYWKIWSRKHHIDKEWVRYLEEGRNADSWWISEKTVPLGDILKIENTKTGEVYFRNESEKKHVTLKAAI